MFSYGATEAHYQDGEYHTVILQLAYFTWFLCLQGSFSDPPCGSVKGCVVFKKLAIGRLNIPFTTADPSFGFAVATLSSCLLNRGPMTSNYIGGFPFFIPFIGLPSHKFSSSISPSRAPLMLYLQDNSNVVQFPACVSESVPYQI